jgi:hypothetical protein
MVALEPSGIGARDGGPGAIAIGKDGAEDFEEIFKMVKRAVKAFLGKERSGLMLVLADLPPEIGAFHSFGSNSIVMNRIALDAIRAGAKGDVEVESYIFVVLLHEYLHSLGYLDESQTRMLVYEICKGLFGRDHQATRMASRGPLEALDRRIARSARYERPPSIVRGFDPAYRGYIH